MTAFERLDDFAAGVLGVGMSPAVAVAVTDTDRPLVSRTYGAAAPDALWPIAPIGKSFTAVVALQLADEGLLDLHDGHAQRASYRGTSYYRAFTS